MDWPQSGHGNDAAAVPEMLMPQDTHERARWADSLMVVLARRPV